MTGAERTSRDKRVTLHTRQPRNLIIATRQGTTKKNNKRMELKEKKKKKL